MYGSQIPGTFLSKSLGYKSELPLEVQEEEVIYVVSG